MKHHHFQKCAKCGDQRRPNWNDKTCRFCGGPRNWIDAEAKRRFEQKRAKAEGRE